jgi:hypothetical protein
MDFILHLACDLISHGNRPTYPKVVKNQQTKSREVYKNKGDRCKPYKSLFKKP